MTHDENLVTAAQFAKLLEAALQPIKEDVDFLKEHMLMRSDLDHYQARADIRHLQLRNDFGKMSFKLGDIESLAQRSDRDIDNVLLILERIEKKFDAKHGEHEHRVKRLEKKAGLAQTAA